VTDRRSKKTSASSSSKTAPQDEAHLNQSVKLSSTASGLVPMSAHVKDMRGFLISSATHSGYPSAYKPSKTDCDAHTRRVRLAYAWSTMKQDYASFAFAFDEVRAPRHVAGELSAETSQKVARCVWDCQCINQLVPELRK
jgi:hypothetical protein